MLNILGDFCFRKNKRTEFRLGFLEMIRNQFFLKIPDGARRSHAECLPPSSPGGEDGSASWTGDPPPPHWIGTKIRHGLKQFTFQCDHFVSFSFRSHFQFEYWFQIRSEYFCSISNPGPEIMFHSLSGTKSNSFRRDHFVSSSFPCDHAVYVSMCCPTTVAPPPIHRPPPCRPAASRVLTHGQDPGSGTLISRICWKNNSDPVEFNQPLFIIE